jgi:hypothetical protein
MHPAIPQGCIDFWETVLDSEGPKHKYKWFLEFMAKNNIKNDAEMLEFEARVCENIKNYQKDPKTLEPEASVCENIDDYEDPRGEISSVVLYYLLKPIGDDILGWLKAYNPHITIDENLSLFNPIMPDKVGYADAFMEEGRPGEIIDGYYLNHVAKNPKETVDEN